MKEIIPYIMQGALLCLLFTGSLIDVKSRELPILLPAIGAAVGIGLQCLSGEMKFYEVLLGCVPGCALLLFAFLTRQAIGYGDGAVFAASGLYLGLFLNLLLLLVSLAAAGIAGGILLALKKKKKKSTLPFLPFVLTGYVVLLAFL